MQKSLVTERHSIPFLGNQKDFLELGNENLVTVLGGGNSRKVPKVWQ